MQEINHILIFFIALESARVWMTFFVYIQHSSLTFNVNMIVHWKQMSSD